jgi:two-component system chemotaxis response regulator CheB
VFACAGKLHATYSDDAARRGHRPAVDVLFEACSQVGVHGVAAVLTGMGQDGAQGLVRLRERGWATFGQDEASCAIYGMPRAAKALGGVERELPLAAIAPAVIDACRGRSLALRG